MKLKYSIFFLVCLYLTEVKALFIENKGQVLDQYGKENSEVLFIHHQNGLKVILRRSGFSYEYYQSNIENSVLNKIVNDEYQNPSVEFLTHRIDFEFPSQPEKLNCFNEQNVITHFYLDNSEIVNVKSYSKIIYKNVHPEVDIEFTVDSNGLFKYNLIFHNYQTSKTFFLKLDSGTENQVDGDILKFDTRFGLIKEIIPKSYIQSNSKTIETLVTYQLINQELRFGFPSFGKNENLIIDPEPQGVWGTYFGGSEYDIVTAITNYMDNIYTTGITMSSNMIATVGAHESNYQGGLDGFVSKYDDHGDLIWSTYYGGPQTDRPYAISIDSAENIYFGGASYSEIGIATIGNYQDIIQGTDDIFVVKLTSNGIREWGTYIGGAGHDFVTDLDIFNNQLFITGHTTSLNGIATAGTFLSTHSANETGYLICMALDGNSVIWGTFIGSNNGGSGQDLDFVSNAIVVGGRTTATAGIATQGTQQSALAGFGNGFLQKFDLTGNLIWGTYFGGIYTDKIQAITTDSDENIYVTGDASSTTGISTPDAYQPTRLSGEQGFLAKFNTNGLRVWGTYLGGLGSDYLSGIIISDSVLLVTGKTTSQTYISTLEAFQDSLAGGYDGFFNGFDLNGSFLWGSYIGGEQDDNISDICVNAYGNFFLGGDVSSNDISFGAAQQNSFGGGINDGCLFKFCLPNTISINYENGYLIASGATEYEWFIDGESIGLYSDSILPQLEGNYSVMGSFQSQCEKTSDSFYYSTIGVDVLKSIIDVFPNPINNVESLQIRSTDIIHVVEIFTIEGQNIKTVHAPSDSVQINFKHYESGIYIVKILTDKGVFDKKIIKL
jgi:hypothetical protein